MFSQGGPAFFAISGPPTNKGNRKFPNPPIMAGILSFFTIKKIRDYIFSLKGIVHTLKTISRLVSEDK